MRDQAGYIVPWLWLIPACPMLAGGFAALLKQRQRRLSATLAIGSIWISLVLALAALAHTLNQPGREIVNFRWMQFGTSQLGSSWIRLGWALDPLTAVMLVMIAFIALLVFLYSVAYMAHDANFTRFFCFLSLFAGAMFGLVIANSLLLLFMCWEVVGLTSYLLIGFWYHRPAAASAAKKAFLTTRIGDLGLLLGIVWLYSKTGTLLFYDHGAGCLEHGALSSLLGAGAVAGVPVATAIALLIFCGAVGKSGQLPLHVWLPDAMEGPTPVSALIHAATMVAAGVYLVARVYPLMSLSTNGIGIGGVSTALKVVAWTGAVTAVFAAGIAVAQNDVKRILAYSTISQLGYMMLGLATGGVAVGVFHLVAHAFFKALLFLGAGSVIHGCTEEQDIRNMGGLRRFMPITFAAYAAGTLALCGFPLLFSGFWSKDAILYAAHGWAVSQLPFYLGIFGALLTAFYMTRQVCYVFFGSRRDPEAMVEPVLSPRAPAEICVIADPHESPRAMTVPLVVLAFFAVVLGFINTPAWPWFERFLEGDGSHSSSASSLNPALDFGRFAEAGLLPLMLLSSLIVFGGLALGWWFYGRNPIGRAVDPDALERLMPPVFHALQHRLYIDELYGWTIVPLARLAAHVAIWLDSWVWNGAVQAVRWLVAGLGWMDASLDEYAVNGGFDEGCRRVAAGGQLFSRLQSGRVQSYLRAIAAALVALTALLLWRSAR